MDSQNHHPRSTSFIKNAGLHSKKNRMHSSICASTFLMMKAKKPSTNGSNAKDLKNYYNLYSYFSSSFQ